MIPARLLQRISSSQIRSRTFGGTAVTATFLARRPILAGQTPWLPRQAALSTKANGTGNPNIIESFPTTVDEIDIDQEFPPSESIPASSSLKTTPSPTSEATPSSTVSPYPEAEGINGFGDGSPSDWSKSYHGLSSQPFPKEVADILQSPVDPLDIEIKPDGLIYLPEIKYRRILNKAFGPGGWGLAPRSETNVGAKVVSREYALVCLGRLVSIARGEQEFFDPSGIATATEACKSNALMRCCKDLGVASELWDPRFIREFKDKHCVEAFVEHIPTKRKRKLWRRKDSKFEYPYKE